MAQRPLEPGEWRAIRCYKPTKARPSWLAVAQYRDPSPPFKVRQRSKAGRTRAEAREALEATLGAESRGSTPPDRNSHLRVLAEDMFARKRTAMTMGTLSDGTLRNYESYWRNYIEPALGDVPVNWLTVRRVDQYLRHLRETKGYATVKGVRSVLAEILQEGVLQDIITDNPVYKADDIRGDGPRRVRALPIAEAVDVWRRLQNLSRTPSPDAGHHPRTRPTMCDPMVPDLWLWMLGTGLRISQALAVQWPWIDMDAGTARVGPNLTRIRGRGLVLNEGTSKSQVTTINLPEQVVAMLIVRGGSERHPRGPLFPNGLGQYLDPANVASKHLRPALDAIGRRDVSSHDCRRALASELNAAGLNLMDIAAQLAHADTRTTEKYYAQKRATNPRVLAAMNAMLATEPQRRVVPLNRAQ